MNFSDLANPESDLVQASLKHRCPVCGVDSGVLCRNLTDGTPLSGGGTGRLVHLMRADGLK